MIITYTYSQTSGLIYRNGIFIYKGYSGIGEGLNNPLFESIKGKGPIPRGDYDIGPGFDAPQGVCTMRLIPRVFTNTYGRSGFEWHGDLLAFPGKYLASHGCIITIRSIREMVNQDAEKYLEVVL